MIRTTFNQYRITASIGAGGMGEVFRARDTRLNRDVAIKVLPKDFVSDADRLRRFEQEAKTLAALNHPNVLTIHDAGVDDGAPYLVSELLEGQTLREEMNPDGLGLPVRKATDYALQIAHGLAAAHGKGVIHRDLKPENIFITKDGRVKILDFGLAKLKGPVGADVRRLTSKPGEEPEPPHVGSYKEMADSNAPTVMEPGADSTEPGLVLGTPAYMSPEQVRGEPADHRADIFAFGCVLYEMLSGTRAFRRDTPVESMNAVLNEALPELSTTHPSIPLPLARIVERCLEKQPDNRFQSAKDLAFTIEAARDKGQSASGGSQRDTSVNSRQRQLVFGIAVLVLLAVGVGWWFVHQSSMRPKQFPSSFASAGAAPRITSLAVKPLDDFSGDTNSAYLSDGMTEALCAALGNVSALRVPGRSSVMRYKGGQKTIQEMAKELNVEAIVEGSVQRAASNMLVTVQLIEAATDRHLWATNYQRDLSDFFKVQNEVAQAIAAEIRVRMSPHEEARLTQAPWINPAALEAYLRGRFQMARATKEGFEQSLASFSEALRIDPKFAKAYAGVADAYVLGAGWWVEDSVVLSLGFQAATNAVALDPYAPEAHSSLGWYHMMSWRWPAAEESFKTALDLNPRYARALNGYGWLNLFTDRGEAGLRLLVQAQESDPGAATFAADVAWACVDLGRYDLAATYLDKAFNLERDFWFAQGLRGLMLAFQGNYPEAILWAEKAVQNSQGNGEMLGNLGWIHGKAGDSAKARAVLDELRTTPRPEPSHPQMLAWVYLGLDQQEEAIKQLQEAVRKRDAGLMFLRFDRRFDPLRQDARFQEITKRVGLDK